MKVNSQPYNLQKFWTRVVLTQSLYSGFNLLFLIILYYFYNTAPNLSSHNLGTDHDLDSNDRHSILG